MMLTKRYLKSLKTRKASLQHELVCNKTMTAYDEVVIVVAIDTVNSLLSTHSNGSLVYLIDSNQVNRAGQANNCKCPVSTHNAHFVNPIFAHCNIHKMHSCS